MSVPEIPAFKTSASRGAEQITGLAAPAQKREIPPDSLALPDQDVLITTSNNFRASSTHNAWARLAPRP